MIKIEKILILLSYCFFAFIVTKKVSFIFKDEIYNIYITIDDGPSSNFDDISKLLKKMKTPATFFFIGKNIIDSTGIQFQNRIKKNSLFLFANHTYSHANEKYKLYYESPLNVLDDIKKMEKYEFLNHSICRLPGRNVWFFNQINTSNYETKLLTKNLSKHNIRLIGWDIEWLNSYSDSTSIEGMEDFEKRFLFFVKNKKTMMKNRIVILLHENQFSNSENLKILELFISKYRKDKKFRFGKLDEID